MPHGVCVWGGAAATRMLPRGLPMSFVGSLAKAVLHVVTGLVIQGSCHPGWEKRDGLWNKVDQEQGCRRGWVGGGRVASLWFHVHHSSECICLRG